MTWVEERPSGKAPAVRQRHSMAYDPKRHSMIVFGGRGPRANQLRLPSAAWRRGFDGSPGLGTCAACLVEAAEAQMVFVWASALLLAEASETSDRADHDTWRLDLKAGDVVVEDGPLSRAHFHPWRSQLNIYI